MPRYLGCALTHLVFGVLLFVLGIIDLRAVNNGDRTEWSEIGYFVIFYGVWMWITGGILAINCKNTSCIRKALTGVFITSSLCSVAVGVTYSVLLFGLSFCEYPCEPQTTVPTIVCILGFLPCIAGCSGCYCVASSSRQADQILCPPNVPGGIVQMMPTCMPPQSVSHANDRPPPYDAGCPGPDLLLVPLEGTPMSLQSVVQQNDRPPPYTVDAQNCSHGSDLLLVPLEMTPMPPQETGPPPPYHQISTTESVMSSFHDGHQPPPYVCTDEQHRVTTYV